MPRVPSGPENLGVLSPSGGADVPNYAYESGTANAVAGLGNVVASFGSELMQTRKRAQDSNYVFQRTSDRQRELLLYTQDLQKSLPTDSTGHIDYTGYAGKIQEWVNDKFKQDQDEAPSQEAKQDYIQKAGASFQKFVVDAIGTENTQRAVSFRDGIASNLDKNNNLLVQLPNANMAADWMMEIDAQIQAGIKNKVIDQALARDLMDRNRKETPMALLEGLYAKARNNPKQANEYLQQGIDILTGKAIFDKDFKKGGILTHRQVIADGIEPHQRAAMLEKFGEAIKFAKHSNLSELHHRVSDAISQAENGLPQSKTLFNDIDQLVSSEDMEADAGIRMKHAALAAGAYGQMKHIMEQSNPTSWPSQEKQFDAALKMYLADAAKKDPSLKAAQEPGFNAQVVNGYKAQLQAYGKQLQAAREKDPAGYVDKYFGTGGAVARARTPEQMEKAIQSRLIRQEQLGIPSTSQRVISKSDSDNLGAMLASKDPAAVNQAFTYMEQKYGKWWQDAFSEMETDKNVKAPLWAASFIQDRRSRQSAIENILNKKQIEESFHAKKPGEMEKSDLTQVVMEEIEPWYSPMVESSSGGGGFARANAERELIILEAQKLVATGDAEDYKQAAQIAAKMLHSSGTPIAAGNSKIVVPHVYRGVNIDPRVVQAFLEKQGTTDALNSMHIAIDPSAHGPDVIEAAKKYARWYQMPNKATLQLEIRVPGQRRVVLYRKRKADGILEPITVDVDWIMKNANQDTLERANKGTPRKIIEDLVK